MLSLKRLFVAFIVFGMIGSSGATVIVDPEIGRSGSFSWVGGIGPIDGIDGVVGGIWQIAGLSRPGTIDIFVVDSGLPGDMFELVFDGSVIAWTSSGFSPEGYFFGRLDALELTAVTHNFSLNMTAVVTESGSLNSYRFSPITYSVAEPGSLALCGLCVVGLIMASVVRARLQPGTS